MTVPQFTFKYRMGAGFPGDVNRAHPFWIDPTLNDGTNPVATAGLACVINSAGTGVRGMASGDTAVATIYGVTVRAYPIQDPGTGETYGAASVGIEALPAGATIDVLRFGYINVPIVGSASAPVKGAAVYVWVAASSGAHIQGGFETSNSGSTSAQITNASFNGPPDSNGYGEIEIKLQ